VLLRTASGRRGISSLLHGRAMWRDGEMKAFTGILFSATKPASRGFWQDCLACRHAT
jgi:hypothetical protein